MILITYRLKEIVCTLHDITHIKTPLFKILDPLLFGQILWNCRQQMKTYNSECLPECIYSAVKYQTY